MFRSKVGLFFEAKQKISEKSYQQFADCVFLQRQKLMVVGQNKLTAAIHNKLI